MTQIIISLDKLNSLLKDMHHKGATSHSNWNGQPDTCWSNVNQDAEEEIASVLKNLQSQSNINLETKLKDAFHMGELWGTTYQGWFIPNEDQHQKKITDCIEKLLP